MRVNDIDIKTSNKITRSLAEALGNDFDVLQHGKGANRHIHLEYDPKGTGYNNGGIVPGSSMTGDLVPVRVNSGEMILNRNQQKKPARTGFGYYFPEKSSFGPFSPMSKPKSLSRQPKTHIFT